MMDETTRFDGVTRRTLLKASAVEAGAFGLAGCTGTDAAQDGSQDASTMELDLETLEADTEFGTLRAERAANSYVGPVDDGQAVGVAFLDEVGAERPRTFKIHRSPTTRSSSTCTIARSSR